MNLLVSPLPSARTRYRLPLFNIRLRIALFVLFRLEVRDMPAARISRRLSLSGRLESILCIFPAFLLRLKVVKVDVGHCRFWNVIGREFGDFLELSPFH